MDTALNAFKAACSHMSTKDKKRIVSAYHLAVKAHEGQKRRDGKPYIEHPVAVAELLCGWGADSDTVIAGILHDTVEDSSLTIKDIEDEFGSSVASLVEGVTKFTKMDLIEKDLLSGEVETLRKLFEVMRKDIRVFIIKIADRIHNLRTIEGLSDERRISFAKESLDVYYKIAYHLGMGEVCREITNICIPYVYPEKAKIRDQFWKDQKKSVYSALKQIDESLHSKMKKGHIVDVQCVKSSHDIPRINNEDESAYRAYYCIIIAKDEDSCYSTFKALHSLYHPVRRKFHDYIASPPESGYRSLHTSIIGPHDKQVQIRIRTQEMDMQNRYGVLQSVFGSKDKNMKAFSWLERSADLDRTTRESSEAFWDALQSDIFQKSIGVVVNGETVSVPLHSTALDAVYLQKGENAHKTQGITLNGKKADFGTELNEDDVLEVQIHKKRLVQFEWLQLVTTKYARNQIVEALKEIERRVRFELGQKLLQKELDYFQKKLVGEISKNQKDRISEHFQSNSLEDVIVMIGGGVVSARSVVEAMRKDQSGQSKECKFNFEIAIQPTHKDEIIPQISTLARLHNISIGNITVYPKRSKEMVILHLRGTAKTEGQYVDFIAALERHSWVSAIKTLMTKKQKTVLSTSFIAAFTMLVATYFTLAYFAPEFAKLSRVYNLLIQICIITPSLIANFHLMRSLRHFIVQLRDDRLFLVLIMLINIATCSLIVYQNFVAKTFGLILPFVSVFMFFISYTAYRFITTEKIFAQMRKEELTPLSQKEWRLLKKKKFAGYAFRFAAVIIWGIQPLYLRYTPANLVSPMVRVFFTGVGVLVVTLVFVACKRVCMKKKIRKKAMLLPKNIYFYNIIFGYILFTYFLNASLQHTTSTNFILFNNFSPVIALIVAAILWRSTISYLKDPQKMLWIFLIFLMGSTGATMIILSSVKGYNGGSPYGDLLGICAMIADTLLVISQIRYMHLNDKASSIALNLYVFTVYTLLIAPIMLWFYITGNPVLIALTATPVIFAIGAGVLAGVGQILNYETFRRIDGFIAYLMFNISILITFVVEVFFLDKFTPSWLLLVGGSIVIASTMLAELINSHCQRKGL
ncbi:MAG: HD domain-containing protein [bacterium]|nr:HD domain-containing protein [bacterium]